ncbi:MAG: hypothetical protein GX446_17250 [Chthonomonadales bacterium]|nr:hypothetical protein [Chthonomonadales bacterium]
MSHATASSAQPRTSGQPVWALVVIPGLALSIGWGIRGNFGHEHGAMIPGALAAMAAALVTDRSDWHRRVAFFGLFGGIGWAFGGSMSYGQVLGYTHCGDPPNVLYGFASLYLIGFLWAAMGGIGTALPAYLDRERLTALLPPLLWFFGALTVHDLTYDGLNVWLAQRSSIRLTGGPEYRHEEPLYWFDSDWTTALIGVAVPLVYMLGRRRRDHASALMLHIAVGWWIGFLLLPVALGWRMTPPRGDNWAGCLGAVCGAFVFLQCHDLVGVTRSGLVAGFVGGVGFPLATAVQILGVKTGWVTNWHSVMEQTYGLINGVGIGLAMAGAARDAAPVSDAPPVRRWSDWLAPAAVLVGITYLNARKNPEEWVKAGAFPPGLYWLSTMTWFNIGAFIVAAGVVVLLIRHMRKPLSLMPSTWEGRGLLLFVAFLSAVVVMNFERALVGFREQRLITEGIILVNATVTSVLIACWSGTVHALRRGGAPSRGLAQTVAMGLTGGVLCCLVCLGTVMAAYGTKPIEFRKPSYRFGARARMVRPAPLPGQPHP